MKNKKEKTLGRYVSAAVAATSIVALCSLVARGAAVGAVVSGFKAAKKAASDILNSNDRKSQTEFREKTEICSENVEGSEVEGSENAEEVEVKELELTRVGEDALSNEKDGKEE